MEQKGKEGQKREERNEMGKEMAGKGEEPPPIDIFGHATAIIRTS